MDIRCGASLKVTGSELTLWGLYSRSSTLLLRLGASDLEVYQALGVLTLSGPRENLVRFGICREIVGEVFRPLTLTWVRDELRVLTVP